MPPDSDRPFQRLLTEAEQAGRILHREDIYGSGPPVDLVSEEILAYVAANVGRRVLDVGCGCGPYSERLSALGHDCIGVDLNPAALEIGRVQGRDLRLMSAYDLEFADDSFDSVILVETLEHLDDVDAALREAVRVARETIVVTVPDISSIPIMSSRLVVPWHLLEGTHVNFFTPALLATVLTRYAARCEPTQLGHFFDVDGQPVYMHAAATAHISDANGRPSERGFRRTRFFRRG